MTHNDDAPKEPALKGGGERLVPCARCRRPVLIRFDDHGARIKLNANGTPHACAPSRS